MNSEQIQQETDNLRELNVSSLNPEQLDQLVNKLSILFDNNNENILSQINVEENG